MEKINMFWFRRDLRLSDNTGLYHALKSGRAVQPFFIFDKNILDELASEDQRVDLIHQMLQQLNRELKTIGSGLLVLYDMPDQAFAHLIENYSIDTVYTNHDYEPYAQKRDEAIEALLKIHNIQFQSFKDQVIFEKNEIVKDDGTPYTVFTPYSKRWKMHLHHTGLKTFNSAGEYHNFYKSGQDYQIPALEVMGFQKTGIVYSKPLIDKKLISNYHNTRDFPAQNGTTQLSVHLRFGTLSIRALTDIAMQYNEKFLNELIWRDFYQMLLWQFPDVVNAPFKSKYNSVKWRNNEIEFAAWCTGNTGYPIVDAGMRELNSTGWMQNRVRMITASFLTKHLLIDWRWGEAYFAEKLLDFDLASNNGGWQWAAGCGADSAPYFRIFNPTTQTLKFDKDLQYIKKWVPEFESFTYPKPIVVHDKARKRCLETYKSALNSENDY